ncbi:hypothetical protein IV203_038307 [Nitzschia inconspicua]|uniref:Uncharacterized protein n=1 Tax=Nitzschia inconspicua TaxID=303405 RepID=A0A9K3LMC6_9STRA|nr:hypothetical protein IV203_038307 [Nitzschia inconspicua]
MDNNIHINQYNSMSSKGRETPSPGAAGLTSLHFTPPIPRLMYVAGPSPDTANHSPPGVENNSPATGRDIADSQIDPASNTLAADVVTEAPTVAVENPYTPEQLAVIEEIAEEASSMFSVGATFQSSGELRDAVRKFAHKKGFSVTSFGNRFSCSRCAEAACYRAKRLKRQQQTAPDKRRKRNTTRVGCSFQVSYTHLNRKEKRADQLIRINASTCYRHSNGCFPSSSQLSIEKRKAGAVAAAVNESRIKSILTVMATGQRMPAEMLRRWRVPGPNFFAGHLNFQRNAPAEANHASIVARIGSLVMEPVTLIESLMERHLSISSERNHCISVRHVQSQALAVQSTDVATREALKGLSSWGLELYEKATRHLQRMHHRKNQSASTAGESSAEQQLGLDHPPEGDDDLSMRYCVFGDEEEMSDGEEACSFAPEEASRREDPATSQEVHAMSRADTVPYRVAQSGKYNLRELYQIFQDLAHCINKVRDPTTKDLLVGTALKLKDVAVGNVEQVYSQPILDTLHSYLHLFGRTMAPQDMFAQASRGISHLHVDEDGENQYEPGAAATLKNSKPPGANGELLQLWYKPMRLG